VHSGVGGSIFPNAAWRLVWALNSLKDQEEHIGIAGFYDAVQPPSARDRELLSALPDPTDDYKSRYGVPYFLKGATGVELEVQGVFSPTCTICGLTSGYQGPGSKTVLPARASAKVDFRLVPDQEPDDIRRKLRAHLDSHGFTDVKITDLGGDAPARTDPDDPLIQMVATTARDVFGVPMTLVPMIGGSGPSHPFVHDLGLPVATAGLGHPDSRAHAPNENIRIDLYLKHARHMARILTEFGR
jgi:acetylornithine deacetylase/succinyl-diaminopimelate desuccinylase-like protein